MLYRIGWISAEKKKRLLSPSGETHNKSYMQDSQFHEGKSIQKEAKPAHTIYPFRGFWRKCVDRLLFKECL